MRRLAIAFLCLLALTGGLNFDADGEPTSAEAAPSPVRSSYCGGDDPKNPGWNPQCMSSLQWCLNTCDAEYDGRAVVCSHLGYTPQAALCHGANSVVYGVCRAECHQSNP